MATPTQTTTPRTDGVTRLAKVVTDVFAPAVLVAGISVAVAVHSGSLLWGILAAVFASGIPISYILRGVRRGQFTDRHVRVRRSRPKVLLVAAASVAIGLAAMIAFKAPRELVALVVAMMAGLALTISITHWWTKVSIHAAIASGTATILALVFGPVLLVVWLVVALVGWSRIHLREHTLTQVIMGAALGAAAAGLVFPPLR